MNVADQFRLNACFANLLRFYDKNIQPIHIEGLDFEELTCDCCMKENAKKQNSIDNLELLGNVTVLFHTIITCMHANNPIEKEVIQLDLASTQNAGSATRNLTYESMLCAQCKKIQVEAPKKTSNGAHGNHVVFKKMLYKMLDADFVEMANSHGYQVENHYTVTQDGYILGLHRILPKSPNASCKGVVFFQVRFIILKTEFQQHGFMQNSECFIARGPKNSLPYILSDLG